MYIKSITLYVYPQILICIDNIDNIELVRATGLQPLHSMYVYRY